jgi:hypothetical protein
MKSSKKDSWRRRYLRLLTEPLTAETQLSSEDFQAIADLIKQGYLRGMPQYDASVGRFTGAVVEGTTLNGHILPRSSKKYFEAKRFGEELSPDQRSLSDGFQALFPPLSYTT